MSLEDLGKLDAEWGGTKAAAPGESSFEAIPEDTKVKAVLVKQTPSLVGDKQTPVCKVEFQVVEPEVYARKKIWHDFWLTLPNMPYLKRDLTTLRWAGTKPTQLLQNDDASLIGLGAEFTVGIETYQAKDRDTGALKFNADQTPVMRSKNTIKFFDGPYQAPQDQTPAPARAQAPQGVAGQISPEDDIPF